MQLSAWFTNNWDSIKTYANILVTNKTPNLLKIANMPITSYKADKENVQYKKSKAFKTLLNVLSNALSELNLNDVKIIFDKSLQNLINYVESNSPTIENVKTVTKKHNDNTQYNQLELVLQQIINNLPKHLQHNARQVIINNSNNKLKALEKFINENNL